MHIAASTDKTPAIGQILPMLQRLKAAYLVKEDDTPFVKMVEQHLWNDLCTRCQQDDVQEFLQEATACDPKFKHTMWENEAAWNRVVTRCTEEYKKYHSKFEVVVKQEPGTSTEADIEWDTDDEVEPEPSTKKKHTYECTF